MLAYDKGLLPRNMPAIKETIEGRVYWTTDIGFAVHQFLIGNTVEQYGSFDRKQHVVVGPRYGGLLIVPIRCSPTAMFSPTSMISVSLLHNCFVSIISIIAAPIFVRCKRHNL